MAFCIPSPFAQLAASPLAAAFPGADLACAADPQNASSGSATDEFFADGFGCDPLASAFSPAPQVKRALTSVPLRAGSYCLAGSLSDCKAAKALGRTSCGPACAGQSCSADPSTPQHSQRRLLPQHMSLPPFRDLDALLAAAACKPGYRARTELGTPAAAGACAGESCMETAVARAAPAPAVCAVLEQYGARHVADGSAGGIADAALGLIAENTLADTFYLYNLGEVSCRWVLDAAKQLRVQFPCTSLCLLFSTRTGKQ